MKNDLLDNALKELTPMQAEAVSWNDGAMFVLAGPGSGKTRVLTTRVARLLGESPTSSFKVLALTFTNKAADEMLARVVNLVPEMENRAVVGTFHSFCMQLLQQHGAHIGVNPDFAIYSLDSDRRELIKEAIHRIGCVGDETAFLKVIDKLKSKLVPPEGCYSRFTDKEQGKLVESAYSAYDALLKESNALDFGSLIAHCFRLVATFPGIAQRIRRTYRYWLFDEFQDTTDGQYRLIKELAGNDFRNIFAVADDDQIIYQWNGASFQQIQRFRSDFVPAEVQLPTNYRCPPIIVNLANRLVANNSLRSDAKKPLEAGKRNLLFPDDQHLSVFRFSTDVAEASGIANSIFQLGVASWGEVVVIARTRALLERVHSELASLGVSAVIAQRRDDFVSPAYQWMCAVLKQVVRPLDKLAFEAMVGAFNRWFDLKIRADEVLASAEVSSKTFLEEWAASNTTHGSDIAQRFANLALECSRNRSSFRDFIHFFTSELASSDEANVDLSEDRAAWDDISRSIYRSIGQNVQLELFLQELAIRSKEPPMRENTVTLMTIHAAKGKEFDHVYVIGMAEDVLPSFQSLRAGDTSAEMEEERRNCFVAITRAKERLCLSYASSYRGYSKKASRFLTEMGLELPSTVVG